MGNYQQKILTTLSLGIVFSLSSAVGAKAASVTYEPILNSDNNPSFNLGQFFSSYTLGYQFSVNPSTDGNNLEMTAFGVYAPPNDLLNPINATNLIPNPGPFDDPNFVFLPDTAHEIALWEVDSDGNALDIDPDTNLPIPVRRITLEPEIDDPDNPGTLIPNPLLGFIYDTDDPNQNYGFAYLALDDPSDPVTPDDELDDILVLNGSEQFFRMGVSYSNDKDQAWISSLPLFSGEVIVPDEDLDNPPGPGAALDPMVVLQPNLAGGGQPQGYYATQSDPSGDSLLFPNDEVLFGFADNNTPFFVAGNILFGPLPPGFPIATTSTGTGTDGPGTGTDGPGTGTDGPGTGTDGPGTGTGGVPTIPEPNLIHGLLAMTLGGMVRSVRQKGKASL
ncbi:MAG: histidinol dehydrogenase [Crocosphaera sp.]|nr:histidinol dehydrogenase [Crocosphaera sp.]